MSTHTCIDCDSPGDGFCSKCHGSGRVEGMSFSGSSGDGGDSSCSACGGSGDCSRCDGSGEVEVGGES